MEEKEMKGTKNSKKWVSAKIRTVMAKDDSDSSCTVVHYGRRRRRNSLYSMTKDPMRKTHLESLQRAVGLQPGMVTLFSDPALYDAGVVWIGLVSRRFRPYWSGIPVTHSWGCNCKKWTVYSIEPNVYWNEDSECWANSDSPEDLLDFQRAWFVPYESVPELF